MTLSALTRFIDASRETELDLTVDDIRDICYLAAQLRSTCVDLTTSAAGREDRPEPQRAPPEPGDGLSRPSGGAEPWTGSAAPAAGERGDGLTDVEFRSFPWAPTQPYPGLPVRAPATPTLAGSRFSKALRALKRRAQSPTEFVVDLESTISRAADSDVWDPILVPATDRWFGLAVVIDDAASAPAWSAEVRAFLRAPEESGVFGGIRVWRFDSDDAHAGPLTLRGETSGATGGRDSRELVDPTGRRAILVLSDCVGAGWGDGRVGAMIEAWAATSPLAVVHLLPQRLWGRCRPRLVPVDWRSRRPFQMGGLVEWRPRGGDPPATGGSMVPVLDFTAPALARWATLVSGAAGDWIRGMAFGTASVAAAGPGPADQEPTGDGDEWRARVARFRAAASPQAFRLATLLSAAPLQLPVVRMIQRTVLGVEHTVHWAELLLSGLVERIGPAEGDVDADRIEYDFIGEVRDHLLTGLQRREVLAVLRDVSEYITRHMGGGGLDFLAYLTAGGPIGRLDRNSPFARVAIRALRALGGTYAEKAAALETLQRSEPKMPSDPSENDQSGVNQDGDQYFRQTRGELLPPDIASRDGGPVTAPGLPAAAELTDRQRELTRAPIWDVPPRTAYFTGRRDLMQSLRQELVENPNQAAVLVPRALFGLGGVGKTALANEYAYRFGNEYDVVWWIPGEDPADVRRSLVDLSRELKLPQSTDHSETIRGLLDALERGHPKRRWLLVYDNARSPESLRGYLPAPTRHGHVLITSRERAWEQLGNLLQVDVFTRTESTQLLRRRTPQVMPEEAERLATLLDDLPLALHQAAAWLSETGLPVTEYFTRYEQKLELLADVDLPPVYPRPVAATFGVSYDQLGSRSLAAAQLLQLCSHFGPEPISVDMLWRGRYVPELPDPLRRTVLDRTALKRELREISRYELIRYDQARNRFQLHRLVQAVQRSTLPEAEKQATAIHAQSILALANPGNPDDVDLHDQARHAELSPHILPSEIVRSQDPEARKVVLDQIRYRYLVGDYEGSRDLALHVVASWEQQWGEDELTLLAKRHLATTLRAIGELAASLQLNERILPLFRQLMGENHDHSLVAANGLASGLRATGRFRRAGEIDEANLQRHREVLREDDPATLRTANNYAVDQRLLGNFEAARQLDESIVHHWTNGYGFEHPETLFAVSNLVRDLYGVGRYGEALGMQQEALGVHEALLGATHRDVLLARRTIAVLLRKLGRYQQAREYAQVLYAAYRTRFRDNHEHTLAAAMTLSNALRDENKDLESLRSAWEICGTALQHYRNSFPGHPFVEVCKVNFAILLRRLGEVGPAQEMNTEAHAALSTGLSGSHPYTLCCATNLSNDLAATGDYTAACELSASTLEQSMDPAGRGPDHPYTLICALNHSINLDAVGRQDEAASLSSDVIRRFVAVLGPDHPDTLMARGQQRIDADIEPPPT